MAVVKTYKCGLEGVFIPACEKDGTYSPIQCDDGGNCCCADPDSGKRSDCVKAPEKPQCSQEGM